MKVKTKHGYTGQVIGQSLDGNLYHVVLEGSTYSMEHSFDEIPKADCEEVPDKPERWVPEVHQEFYMINSRFEAKGTQRTHTRKSQNRIDVGNCFRTRKQAQSFAEAIQAVLEWLHDPDTGGEFGVLSEASVNVREKLKETRDAVQEEGEK